MRTYWGIITKLLNQIFILLFLEAVVSFFLYSLFSWLKVKSDSWLRWFWSKRHRAAVRTQTWMYKKSKILWNQAGLWRVRGRQSFSSVLQIKGVDLQTARSSVTLYWVTFSPHLVYADPADVGWWTCRLSQPARKLSVIFCISAAFVYNSKYSWLKKQQLKFAKPRRSFYLSWV